MFIKSFISVLIVTSAFTLVFGQAPASKGTAVQSLSFAFDGDVGYLGIQTQEITNGNFAKFGLSSVRGVAVENVLDNSPAAAAGLKANDVIVRFDGEEITSTRKLTRLIAETAPDHQVSLTVVRNGSEQEIAVTVGKRQMPKFESGNFTITTPMPMGKMAMPSIPALPPTSTMPRVFTTPDGEGQNFAWRVGEGRQIGIGVYSLTKQLSETYGVEGGLMINTVLENSPAAKAGLKAGDIIVEADGKAVKGDFDLIRAINSKKEGDIQLTIIRDRNRQTISVTPEASKDSGFVFQTDGDGLTPLPGLMRTTTPLMPTAPMPATPPTGFTVARPARII